MKNYKLLPLDTEDRHQYYKCNNKGDTSYTLIGVCVGITIDTCLGIFDSAVFVSESLPAYRLYKLRML